MVALTTDWNNIVDMRFIISVGMMIFVCFLFADRAFQGFRIWNITFFDCMFKAIVSMISLWIFFSIFINRTILDCFSIFSHRISFFIYFVLCCFAIIRQPFLIQNAFLIFSAFLFSFFTLFIFMARFFVSNVISIYFSAFFALALIATWSIMPVLKFRQRFFNLALAASFGYNGLRHGCFLFKQSCLEPGEVRPSFGSLYYRRGFWQ